MRSRLPWLFVLAGCAALALAGFLQQLALTESGAVQAAILSALLRLVAVFLLVSFVVFSLAREAADKGQELLLALPMPRAVYVLGKLAGFGALALLPALLFGLLTCCGRRPRKARCGPISLLGELWIMAAFSLLCALGLPHALPALAASGGFYVLARSVGSLQLLAHGIPARMMAAGKPSPVPSTLLALLLPNLDHFTRSEWLLYATGDWQALGLVAAQTAIYVGLLATCALCDFYRKSF